MRLQPRLRSLPVARLRLALRRKGVYNATQPGMEYQVYNAKVWRGRPCYNGNLGSL